MDEGRNHRFGDAGDEHLGDAVVDLVLGQVDGQRRATMAAHVLSCPACRREYDDVAASVEDLLPAVPAVQPPIRFDERVLRRLGVAATARGRGPRRRWAWLIGVAAAVVLAVAIPLVWWAASGSDDGRAAGVLATLELTNGGGPVGTVSVTDVDGKPLMVVALVGAPKDVSYRCRTTFTDGRWVESETWSAGNGAWIVPLPESTTSEIARVEVVADGSVDAWSEAAFGSA